MTSPALTEITALVGGWTVEGAMGCRVSLSAQDRALVTGAAGLEMMTADVAGCAGLERVRGWRPIPMGLELTDEGGMTVVALTRVGPDAYRSGDGRFTLRRP